MADVKFGFAAFRDGTFELIVESKEGEHTTLYGTLQPGQAEKVGRILPTCVFVAAESKFTPDEAERFAFLDMERERAWRNNGGD